MPSPSVASLVIVKVVIGGGIAPVDHTVPIHGAGPAVLATAAIPPLTKVS
jgi:hypothetical protein